MYLSKKPITPVPSSFSLTLSVPYIFLHICTHITHSFSAPHPLSTLLPRLLFLFDPWTHTLLLSLYVFLTYPFIPLLSTQCLFTFSFLFIHFNHVLSPHSSSLCQTEISSLYPQATNPIISSPLSTHYMLVPYLLTFSHHLSPLLLYWTPILLQSRCATRPIRQRPYRVALLISAWRTAYWYNLVIRWRNNGLYPWSIQGSKTIGSLGLSVCVCIYCIHIHLCVHIYA